SRRFRHPLRYVRTKRLSRHIENQTNITGKNVDELIHDLQVHQIELEIQNEELKRAYQNLEELKDQYLDIFDFAPVGYIILSDTAIISHVNLTGSVMLGTVRKDLIHDRFRRYVVPFEYERWDHFFQDVLHQGKQRSCTIQMKKSDKENIFSRLTGIRMERAGYPPQIRIAMQDITKEYQQSVALFDSEEKFRLVVENAPDAIYIQTEGRFAFVNPAACNLFGALSRDQLIGKNVVDLSHPKCREIALERIRILNLERKPVPMIEEVILKLDGTPVDVELTAVSVSYLQKNGALVFLRDITERKQAQNVIKSALKEKEILLREVHHRVKNNLAVIIALISMQGNLVSEKKTHDLLIELQSRVMAIALIHESLYNTENIAKINFNEYVSYLIHHIIKSFNPDLDPEIIIEVDQTSINLDVAIPCGLIINELITNSIKYAFPEGTPADGRNEKTCTISVSLKDFGDTLCLKISDNGIGIRGKNSDWHVSKSLGMQIVYMLSTHQLRGTIELDTQNGTTFTIIFKKPDRR
ncbi:MAG TPA: PAS domain S-box protein, partial [Methanospirillum sp.]|nr:PAS domain S-box protein [Methanospirillum sp.]